MKIMELITGEFILSFMPNGGKAVLLRSGVVTILIYAFAIFLKLYIAPSLDPVSINQVRHEISETIPWLGAIFGGSYAALYARFSSQWSYLADLYNQQMATSFSFDETNEIASETYYRWQAAFIEDAIHMHLAKKPGFSNAIYEMLKDKEIRKILEEDSHFGAKKIQSLRVSLHMTLNTQKKNP